MSKLPQQLDVSPETREITEWKVQRRLELRNQFLKLKTDPFQHATGEGGTVFDSAFLRYQSLSVNYWEFFKPTGKLVFRGITLMLLPMFGFGFLMKHYRDKAEASYRRGEVSYRDRQNKFI